MTTQTGPAAGPAAGSTTSAEPAPAHTRADLAVQLVSEGFVDGVELVTILDASGAVLEEHVPLNQHAKVCGC